MNISAAIIVRNEENNIGRCLDSIRRLCRQIVVVDTGSIDSTISLATKYGVDIYFQEWDNNFSKARNYALKHCYSEWILYIDGDEEFVIDEYT
jgi:glycosyltransferase involved in cell wall biosynthesis